MRSPSTQLSLGLGGPGNVLAAGGADRSPAPAPGGAEGLQAQLCAQVGAPVSIVLHENRSTMISFRARADGGYAIRLHRVFLQAGADEVRAIGDYVLARSGSAEGRLKAFLRAHPPEARASVPGERPLVTQGRFHDLAEVLETLNARYFGGAPAPRIGWGRGSAQRQRTIRLGAYDASSRRILIHPALDHPDVPRYFLELVVFHELLHDAIPANVDSAGRRSVHSDEFRAREREFADFERARAWERRHLSILLRPPASRPTAG